MDALDALFAKVAPTLGAAATDLVAEGGRIHVKGNAAKGVAWKDACKLVGTEPIAVDGQWQDGLSGAGTSGVQFAEATVDIETGIVKVTRILAMQDCGLIVDKLTAESQAYGGVIAAINFALFEDRILDRVTGQMVNPNMEWYLLAGMSDVPKIDIVLEQHAASAASSASASRRRCRPRRRSPTRCATPPARRSAACRCTRTRCWRRIEQEKAGGTN